MSAFFKPSCSSRPHTKAPGFSTAYGAIVYAALHNYRRVARGDPPYDLVAEIREGKIVRRFPAGIFRDYKRSTNMSGPYIVISQHAYPQIKFQYATAQMEEAEALVASDERAKNWRDFVIVSAHDKKLLGRFDQPELSTLYRAMTDQKEPDTYVQLLSNLVDLLSRSQVEQVPEAILKQYQRQTGANPPAEESMSDLSTVETTKVPKTPRVPKTAKAAKTPKAAKGPKKTATASGKKGKVTATGEAKGAKTVVKNASKLDPLGRPGSISRFVADLVMEGKDNEAIAKLAAKKFPEKKAVEAKYVAWYRWNLSRKGVKVPEVKA